MGATDQTIQNSNKYYDIVWIYLGNAPFDRCRGMTAGEGRSHILLCWS